MPFPLRASGHAADPSRLDGRSDASVIMLSSCPRIAWRLGALGRVEFAELGSTPANASPITKPATSSSCQARGPALLSGGRSTHCSAEKRWKALTTLAPGASSATRCAAEPTVVSSTPTPCSTALVGSISGTLLRAPSAAPALLKMFSTPSHATASSTASDPVTTSRRVHERATPPRRSAKAWALARDRPPITTSCPARSQPVPSAPAKVPVPRYPDSHVSSSAVVMSWHLRQEEPYEPIGTCRTFKDGGVSAHGRGCEELVADCRLSATTDLFLHRWDPVVLAALRAGPRRRRELRAAIGRMSDKVLTDAIRRLLEHGLVSRHSYAQAPPRVEYRLTQLGESLVDGPMNALGTWAIQHGDELVDAQTLA